MNLLSLFHASLIIVTFVSSSVFKDYQKWPELCTDPHEFCFGEKEDVVTTNITEGCLSNLTIIDSITYNSNCRILLRASISLDDREDHRDVRWRVRVPSDWSYLHLTIWLSASPDLTTNEGCHSIKIIDDKVNKFTKGYGYFKFQGFNFETDQAFGDDGILTPKHIESIINLKSEFYENGNYTRNFTTSPLVNFIWFNFRSFGVLQVERFDSGPIDLIHDKLYIYFTLKGKDEIGNTVQIIARRSNEPRVLFPVRSTAGQGIADSTQLAIVALVAFSITMLILGAYVCMTRERHEALSKGVDVSKDEPNRERLSKEKANEGHRMKLKLHDASHVSNDGHFHTMDMHAAPHH